MMCVLICVNSDMQWAVRHAEISKVVKDVDVLSVACDQQRCVTASDVIGRNKWHDTDWVRHRGVRLRLWKRLTPIVHRYNDNFRSVTLPCGKSIFVSISIIIVLPKPAGLVQLVALTISTTATLSVSILSDWQSLPLSIYLLHAVVHISTCIFHSTFRFHYVKVSCTWHLSCYTLLPNCLFTRFIQSGPNKLHHCSFCTGSADFENFSTNTCMFTT